jgi:predicted transcriptional regulator of viral defense system
MSELIKTGKRLFHTKDLALLWGITRPETLHMRVSRYLEKRILFQVQRGLYSVIPLDKLDPTEVAIAMNHNYCYLSLETIFVRHGVINQVIYATTFISNRSKTILWKDNRFIFQQLKDKFLFQTAGIIQKGDYFEATLERAVADKLYFSKNYYFDGASLINWDKVSEIQKEVGY